jgi:hypothetical protein
MSKRSARKNSKRKISVAHNAEKTPVESEVIHPTQPVVQKSKGGRPAGSKDKIPRKKKFHHPLVPQQIQQQFPPKNTSSLRADLPSSPPSPSSSMPETGTKIESDSKLFGNLPKEEFKANAENPKTAPEPEKPFGDGTGKPNGEDEAKKDGMSDEEQRNFCGMVFDLVTSILAGIIGAFWLPRPVGKDIRNGELPYDERKMVTDSLLRYLQQAGNLVITPLQQLWLALGLYCAPRLILSYNWFRSLFAKKVNTRPAPTPGDTRMPGNGEAAKPQPKTEHEPKVAPVTPVENPVEEKPAAATLEELKEDERNRANSA